VGNTNASPEEATAVAGLVGDLLGRQWCDKDGAELLIGPADVLIITPYNAQVRAIRAALAAVGCPAAIRVGTVDKFQGREAPVAIYSMATSSGDEAPRGLEFLYDHRRLNVATSRAKALAIIVASPLLVQTSCRTPRQMFLVNALCRAWESAAKQLSEAENPSRLRLPRQMNSITVEIRNDLSRIGPGMRAEARCVAVEATDRKDR